MQVSAAFALLAASLFSSVQSFVYLVNGDNETIIDSSKSSLAADNVMQLLHGLFPDEDPKKSIRRLKFDRLDKNDVLSSSLLNVLHPTQLVEIYEASTKVAMPKSSKGPTFRQRMLLFISPLPSRILPKSVKEEIFAQKALWPVADPNTILTNPNFEFSNRNLQIVFALRQPASKADKVQIAIFNLISSIFDVVSSVAQLAEALYDLVPEKFRQDIRMAFFLSGVPSLKSSDRQQFTYFRELDDTFSIYYGGRLLKPAKAAEEPKPSTSLEPSSSSKKPQDLTVEKRISNLEAVMAQFLEKAVPVVEAFKEQQKKIKSPAKGGKSKKEESEEESSSASESVSGSESDFGTASSSA